LLTWDFWSLTGWWEVRLTLRNRWDLVLKELWRKLN